MRTDCTRLRLVFGRPVAHLYIALDFPLADGYAAECKRAMAKKPISCFFRICLDCGVVPTFGLVQAINRST